MNKISKYIILGVLSFTLIAGVLISPARAGLSNTLVGFIQGDQGVIPFKMFIRGSSTDNTSGNCFPQAGNTVFLSDVGSWSEWENGDIAVAITERETAGAGQYTVQNLTLDDSAPGSTQVFDPPTGLTGMQDIPTPAATGQAGRVRITWTAATDDGTGNIYGYKIYRSTTGAAGAYTELTTVAGISHNDNTANNTGTTYHYKIKIVFNGNPNRVDTTYFSPASNGASPLPQADSITVSIPNGGETWSAGTDEDITWTSTGSIANVKIEYSTNGGTDWTEIIDSTSDDGTYTWAIPPGIDSNQCKIQISDAADENPFDTSDSNFTIVPSGTGPSISTISPATAEVGQTIVIEGNNFGATEGEVWFGGVQGVPTRWQGDNIIVAVPSGVDTGTVEVLVEDTNDDSDSKNIEIAGEKIYLDDFEGGAVNSFSPGPDSLYYVFENSDDITPDNDNINTLLRTAEAVYDSDTGANVRYSYVETDGTDWGGGWGAKLANTLDLDSIDKISLFIKWDGTDNQIKFNLQDSDGTAVAATIDNTILANLDVYGEVTLAKSGFIYDEDGSKAGADDQFEWTEVIQYNFVYSGDVETDEYHYLDTITANLTEVPTGDAIYEIEPASGPAGTRVVVSGNGFGDMQGQSMLVFDNDQTGVSYQAREILSWSNTRIVAIVPRLAGTGDYKVKVIKITIIQESGITRAWQSNEKDFRVTASAATEGGIATIYPNPFNPLAETVTVTGTGADANRNTIAFNAGSSTTVGIYIYDMTARLIQHRTVTMGVADSDVQALGWDGAQAAWSGKDLYENMAGDGVYIMKIIDQDSKRVIAKGKILVIKQ